MTKLFPESRIPWKVLKPDTKADKWSYSHGGWWFDYYMDSQDFHASNLSGEKYLDAYKFTAEEAERIVLAIRGDE